MLGHTIDREAGTLAAQLDDLRDLMGEAQAPASTLRWHLDAIRADLASIRGSSSDQAADHVGLAFEIESLRMELAIVASHIEAARANEPSGFVAALRRGLQAYPAWTDRLYAAAASGEGPDRRRREAAVRSVKAHRRVALEGLRRLDAGGGEDAAAVDALRRSFADLGSVALEARSQRRACRSKGEECS